MGLYQRFQRSGLVKMFFSSIFQNPERIEKLINVAQHSFMPLLEGAIKYTIPLTIITFSIGLVIAFFTAISRIFGNTLLQGLARFYISIFRGTPLLVQLFIIFYGLPTVGITIDPLPSAIIGFSLNVGAYASEIIRAAILSIPKVQWEAAYSVGMTRFQALKRVILPQASRVSIPPLSNSFIGLVKDTSLASLILVTEMFRRAQEIAATNYEFLFVYSLAAFIYWVTCFILSIIQGRIEERLERHIGKSGGIS